jgi:tRNA(fMet)-specific endonuclease VapC
LVIHGVYPIRSAPQSCNRTPADAEYGGIRAELEATGQSIGPNDLLITAHAQALGATIVTADVAEFRRVRGLTVENWIA